MLMSYQRLIGELCKFFQELVKVLVVYFEVNGAWRDEGDEGDGGDGAGGRGE